MQKLYVNTGNSPIYVGGQMIPPGEQTMVEVPDAPVAAPDAPGPSLADQVMALLASPVKEIVPGLAGLSDDALELMAAIEQEAKPPRTTLLAAISDEVLQRGAAALEAQAQAEADARIKEANAETGAAAGAPAV